jgi:hypothetical protein
MIVELEATLDGYAIAILAHHLELAELSPSGGNMVSLGRNRIRWPTANPRRPPSPRPARQRLSIAPTRQGTRQDHAADQCIDGADIPAQCRVGREESATEDGKIAKVSTKVGGLARDLTAAEASLDREVHATARREEDKRKAAARRADQEASQRHAKERRHAQEIARLSAPAVHYYVHEVRSIPTPKPEILRVLYLTANPELNLRTEVEVRDVQQAVRRASHRDLIEISYRPAATPEDLLDGLNELRPHVVHFSGHAGSAAVLFDNASIDTPDGRRVTFDLLARALGATVDPPTLLASTAATRSTELRCCWTQPPSSSPWPPTSPTWPPVPSRPGSTPPLPPPSQSAQPFGKAPSRWTSPG